MSAAKKKRAARPRASKPAAESLDALCRREGVRQGVARLTRHLIQSVLQRLDHPRKADRTDDIHQVRVLCKRLRALLRLLKPVTNTVVVKRENLRLRDTARALSLYRDAFVAGETLKRIFEDTAPPHLRRAALLLGVKDRPPKNKKGLDDVLKEVAEALRRTGGQMRRMPYASRGWAALAPGLERAYRNAREDYRRCARHGGAHLGDCFHSWRKRVKDLTYQLEILTNVEPGNLARLHKDFRRLGNLLGEDHDYLVFAHHVRAREQHYENLANFHPVRKRLRRRLKKLRAREFALAGPLLADKPKIWITHLASAWRIWKNPSAAHPVLTIETPAPKIAHSLSALSL